MYRSVDSSWSLNWSDWSRPDLYFHFPVLRAHFIGKFRHPCSHVLGHSLGEIARSSSSKTVKSIRFHLPLVLETPETQARVEIDSKGSYSLIQNNPAGTKICSGETIVVRTPKKLEKNPEAVPSQMMSKTDVYEYFKNVKFGEPFRTVQQVRIWSDHADADIKVSVTENPAHDCIWKLDACLHMFGAIASRVAPEVNDCEGKVERNGSSSVCFFRGAFTFWSFACFLQEVLGRLGSSWRRHLKNRKQSRISIAGFETDWRNRIFQLKRMQFQTINSTNSSGST